MEWWIDCFVCDLRQARLDQVGAQVRVSRFGNHSILLVVVSLSKPLLLSALRALAPSWPRVLTSLHHRSSQPKLHPLHFFSPSAVLITQRRNFLLLRSSLSGRSACRVSFGTVPLDNWRGFTGLFKDDECAVGDRIKPVPPEDPFLLDNRRGPPLTERSPTTKLHNREVICQSW